MRQETAQRLLTAARAHLKAWPAFRASPLGAPGSFVRLHQEEEIAIEDDLRAAIRAAENEGI